ncbi:S-layer homology domain-containing protein [Paenibacillus sp. FSL R7-0652]|uniref:S-layer homology domain-containing protein n=1 Tax=Paenibacillus sp. FSL R7-0652 TaxID=2921687 RepID=UPI0031599D00
MRRMKCRKILAVFLSTSMLLSSAALVGGDRVNAAGTDPVSTTVSMQASVDQPSETMNTAEAPLAKPGNLVVETTDEKIHVTWDAVEGAEKYALTVDGNKEYEGVERIFERFAPPGTSYEIAVWAIDQAGTPGEKSTIVAETKERLKPAAPTNFNVTTDETSLTASWNAAERASGYVVTVDNEKVYEGNDLSCTLEGLTPNKQYRVEIWSVNEYGVSWKSTDTVKTKDPDNLPAPKNLRVDSTWNSITISWDAVEGADKYYVRKNNDYVYDGPDTTYTITNLNPDVPYTLYVYGYNTTSNKLGELGRITGVTKRLPAPDHFKVVPKTNSIKLSWDEVDHAVEYELKRGKLIIYTGPLKTFIDTDLDEGKAYNYTVTAKNDYSSGYPAAASTSTLVTPRLPYPENVRVTELTYNKVRLDWDAVDGAEEYEISRNGMTIGVPMETWWIGNLEGLSGDISYKIAAIRKGVSGEAAVKKVTIPSRPVPGEAPSGNLKLEVNRIYHDQVSLGWNQVAGASYYDVFRDETHKVWSGKLNIKTITDSNMKPEESHTYKVVAGNESGILESNVIHVKTAAKPKPIAIMPAQPLEGTITFDFKVTDGAVMYVERNPQTVYTPLEDGTYRQTYYNAAADVRRDEGIVTPINGRLHFSETGVSPNRNYNYDIVAVVHNTDGTETVVAREGISISTPADGSGATVPGTVVDPGNGGGSTPTPGSGSGNGNGTTPSAPGTETGGAAASSPSGNSPSGGATTGNAKNDHGAEDRSGTEKEGTKVTPREETKSETYTDIDTSYAKEAILFLTSKGIAKGYSDGTFGLKKKVTRAEFAVFLNRALGYTSSSPYAGTFKDIDPKAWYVSELHAAIENDITKGFADHTYRPNEVISREQAAVMLSNVLLKNGSLLLSAVSYEDHTNVASWAKESVKLVTQESVMNGYPGNKFMPKRSLSREEAAQLIYNLVQLVD